MTSNMADAFRKAGLDIPERKKKEPNTTDELYYIICNDIKDVLCCNVTERVRVLVSPWNHKEASGGIYICFKDTKDNSTLSDSTYSAALFDITDGKMTKYDLANSALKRFKNDLMSNYFKTR